MRGLDQKQAFMKPKKDEEAVAMVLEKELENEKVCDRLF